MFKDKNNPLLDAAKAAMQKGDEHRKAVNTVNEHFGVYGRRALPLSKKVEYDIALKKVLEGEKLDGAQLVSEETKVKDKKQQLHEISKNLIQKYTTAADQDINSREHMADYGRKPLHPDDAKAINKRMKGVALAQGKKDGKPMWPAGKIAKVLAKEDEDRGEAEEHSDEKEDKALVKKLVKKSALKECDQNGYSKSSVDKAIKGSRKKIGGKEAKMIHSLLKGRQKSDEPIKEEVKSIKEEIAKNLYTKYAAIAESEKQAWVDALNEEQFNILHEFYNPNVKFRQSNASPLADARSTLSSVLSPAPLQQKPTTLAHDAGTVATGVMQGVRNLAGAAADVLGRGSTPNVNTGRPASGIAAAMPRPTVSPVAAAAKEKSFSIGDGKDAFGNTIPADKIADAIKSAAADNSPSNADQIGKNLAAAATPTPPPAPEVADTSPGVAQTPAAAAETRAFRPREPMQPKRSFGFGDNGSGSDSAGSITNRAFGAVNEEVHTPRSGLDGWLNKYPSKNKKMK